MASQKRVRHDEDEEAIALESTNSALRNESISAARKAVGRQFILITPKALGAGLDVDEDVEMI
ncbi:unnamed protein product, partial [Diplocarpon coronariae]